MAIRGSGTGARYRRGYRRDVTTPDDTPSLSSEEMIRRARENLATPLEELLPPSVPADHTAPIQKTAPPQKPARRLTRIATLTSPRPGQANSVRVLIAIMVVIALIGVGVAILVTSVATAP